MITSTENSIIIKTSRLAFFTGYTGFTPAIDLSRFITEIPTDTLKTDFGWFGPPDYPEERTGGFMTYQSLPEYTHTLEDREWIDGIQIKVKTWEDDKTGTLEPRTRSLAEKAREWESFRLTQIIQDGDGGAIYSAYDGGNFFTTTHPLENSASTWSNQHSENIGTPSAPTATELEGALDGALQLFDQMLDPWGNPLISSGAPIAIIPQNMQGAFRRVTGASGEWGASMTNPANASGATGEFERFAWMVNAHLNGENDRFYLFKPAQSGTVAPFIKVNRTEWDVKTFTPNNSDDCNEKGVIKTTARRRVEFGFGLPQLAVEVILT